MATRRNFTKGEATKKDLMAAAARVFSRKGYVNTEIREISLEAGKSSGTFYIYFKNKSEMLLALIEEFDADLFRHLELRQDEDGKVRPEPSGWQQRMRAIWQTYSTHSATFFALSQAAAVSDEFNNAYGRMRQRAIDDFRQMIAMQQAKGLCRNLDPAIAAIALEAMLNGFLYECLAGPEHKISQDADLDRAVDTLISLITLVLEDGPEKT
jgi:AcrR family transcriptional regulator